MSGEAATPKLPATCSGDLAAQGGLCPNTTLRDLLPAVGRPVTHHFATRQLRFFLTAPTPCPYLPGRDERKVFAHLPIGEGPTVNDALSQVGFRRSQNIAYRPACSGCDACVSARLPVREYRLSRSERRVLARNEDLRRDLVEAEATMEQFELLRRYLGA